MIKARTSRSLNANRADALMRLQEVVDRVAGPPHVLRATKRTYGSKQRQLDGKGIAPGSRPDAELLPKYGGRPLVKVACIGQ